MSLQVTLAGHLYDYNANFANWNHAKPGPVAGVPSFISIFQDFLQDVLNQKAGIASVSGVAPGAVGNVLVSDGANWTRSIGGGVTAKVDALTVSGATSLQAVTATVSGATVATLNRTASNGQVVAIQLLSQTVGELRANAGGQFVIGSVAGGLSADNVVIANNSGTAVATFASTGTTFASGLTVAAGGITVSAGTSAFQAVSVTDTISSTKTGQFFVASGATTSTRYFDIENSGGAFFFGVESSIGGTLITGSTAYATCLTTVGAGQVIQFGINQAVAGTITAFKSLVWGSAALATTATDGFLYIPTCAGAPTGVPTAFAGRLPMVYDTTNHKFWMYDTAWKGVVLA